MEVYCKKKQLIITDGPFHCKHPIICSVSNMIYKESIHAPFFQLLEGMSRDCFSAIVGMEGAI